jgi:adenylylsulfate kinase
MLIAMAGLPATGKSAIAAWLAKELGGIILSKDAVRAALFPAPALDYSREQDDLCMTAICSAAAHILKASSRQVVILDGRTFLRSYQLRDLLALADATHENARIIECVCDDELARERLETALARGKHPARNRTFALYLDLKAAAEPIRIPHLLLDTGKVPLTECVARCLAFLKTDVVF